MIQDYMQTRGGEYCRRRERAVCPLEFGGSLAAHDLSLFVCSVAGPPPPKHLRPAQARRRRGAPAVLRQAAGELEKRNNYVTARRSGVGTLAFREL